jgi:hypothetical protein
MFEIDGTAELTILKWNEPMAKITNIPASRAVGASLATIVESNVRDVDGLKALDQIRAQLVSQVAGDGIELPINQKVVCCAPRHLLHPNHRHPLTLVGLERSFVRPRRLRQTLLISASPLLKIVHDQEEVLTLLEKAAKAELLVALKPVDVILDPNAAKPVDYGDQGTMGKTGLLKLTDNQTANRKVKATADALEHQQNSNHLAGASDTAADLALNAQQDVPKGERSILTTLTRPVHFPACHTHARTCSTRAHTHTPTSTRWQ